ncbi:hypothetical protein ACYSNW_10230 [Enterococcus sp. LJL99]
MNDNSYDDILAENPIAHIDSLRLLLLFFMAIVVGYLLAWVLKNKYDTKYLIRAYLIYGIIHLLIGIMLLKMALVIVIGSYLLGGVFTIFRSNRYFYE